MINNGSKGLWYKYIAGSNLRFRNGNWYKCIKPHWNYDNAFLDEQARPNGWGGYNQIYFDISNPMTKNPKSKNTNPIMNNTYKLEITVDNVLQIHSVACPAWQSKIATTYLPRLTSLQKIKFSEDEINEMFAEANVEQITVLEEVFGKQIKTIKWDKIKTGSKVKIVHDAIELCSDISEINVNEPVDVVFYKTPHLIINRSITSIPLFCKSGVHSRYCTFTQNGKFAAFSAEEDELSYIIEVIEY